MTKKSSRELLIKRLIRCAKRQVRHHGHLCGYGNFPKQSQSNYCPICTPTMEAVEGLQAHS